MTRWRTFLVRLWGSLFLILTSLGSVINPAWAQGGDPISDPGNGAVIHIVQRDETLFRIAMQYGTSVDSIAAANGITDPRYISVGQRLLIPDAQVSAASLSPAATTHTILPGDSLKTLARTYATTEQRLISDNYITNPHLLYAGQSLTVAQGTATEATNAIPAALYTVRPGDTWARIAVQHRVSLPALWQANALSGVVPVFPGQSLWIPGEASPTLTDLPLPFVNYSLNPVPAVQGRTLSVHVTTIEAAALTGTFMDEMVQIVTQDATEHDAFIGVHAFTAAGVYPLNLVATLPDGSRTAFKINVQINEGGYGSELISIDNPDLLKTDVTEPEWQRVATIMSGFTAQRYFDGMMGLPSSGAITSQFGTRRSYNGAPIDTFHSGTDFGAAPGSPVIAPAAGVVVLAEALPVRGNATIIDHGWGVLTGYWHQDQIQVTVGDVVTAGQVIGTVGSTGRSTGPHLHWEMWVGGNQVDPMQWVQQSFP